jgi:hypothetical protein
MADIDEIKATAKQVWPDADHIDISPGEAGYVNYTGKDPEGVRLSAIHKDGSIMGQVIADNLEDLDARMKERLRGKAKI